MNMHKLLGYILVALGLLSIIVFALLFWWRSSHVTPEEANVICSSFSEEVRSDIIAIPSYTIINSSKACRSIQDELGNTDYELSVTVRVAKEGLNSETAIKASLNELSDKLPHRNYPLSIHNVPAKEGQAESICVYAFRYIDNDGKDYPQGPPDHSPRYTVPGSIKGYIPCEGV